MAISKIQLDGTTLIDLSTDTVASSDDIVSGKIGHLNDGMVVTGTASTGGGTDGMITLTSLMIIASATYNGGEI